MAALTEQQAAAEVAADLNSGDLYRIVTAAQRAAQLADDPGEIVVTVWDKYWRRIGEAGDRISLAAAKPRNQVPTVELVMKGSDPLNKYLRRCRTEVVGVTVEVAGMRWAAVVDTASYKLENRQKTLTAQCFGISAILSGILIWPNFLLPIQTQIPSRMWFIGPACSVVEMMIAEQAFRIQSGLWELVNNLLSLNLDWRAWFGRLLTNTGDLYDMLFTPLYVVHHNPFLDGSPWVSGVFRMDTVQAGIDKLIKAYGITVEVELWLPGDPQPDGWSQLKVPTYVVRVNDRSNIVGPTGTLLDGLLFQVVNIFGSMLGESIYPLIDEPTGLEGVFISPILGQQYVQPWPVLIDHEKGPMESFEIVDHHPQGWQLIIGGKSPAWINHLINATLGWLLDILMIIVGVTGIPSSLLDGLFNDAFLAFQLIEHFNRRVEMGPYATRIEKFLATGAAPYNIDAVFSFLTLLHDTRGYRAAQASFRNGLPYWLGRDVFVGGLMSIVDDEGNMLTDYIENVTIRQDRQHACDVMVAIGDGKAEEAPIVKTQRFITGVQEVVNTLMLTPET